MSKLYYVLISAAVSFFCYVLGFSVPVLGFFILPFSSVVLIILLIKQDAFSGIAGMVLSCLLVYEILPSGQIFLIPYIIFVLMNTLLMYTGIVSGRNKIAVLLDSFISVAVVSTAFMLLLALSGFQNVGLLGASAAGFPKEVSFAVEKVFNRDIYSIIIISAAIFVVLSYLYLTLLSQRYILKVEKLPYFYEWRLPDWGIFLLIFALSFYMAGKAAKGMTLLIVAENILILVAFAYFINGLSVGTYIFKRARILLWIMCLFSFLYPPSAVFLGISDVWLNFRKKRGNDNEDNFEKGN